MKLMGVYVVDILDGNIREEIYIFVDIVVRCNFKVFV